MATRQPADVAANGDAAVRGDLTFDVVSIRPSEVGSDHGHLEVRPDGDRYEAFGMPLGVSILMGYFPVRMGSRDRIIGTPSWVWNDKYDFVGKVAEADLPAWQKLSQRGFELKNPMLQTMLQNALADRCKMVVQRVPAQINGYALVVAKQGPNRKNLIDSRPDDAIPDRAIKIALDGMTAFALEMSSPAPIEDRTGLSGKYKFDLSRLGTEGTRISDWDLAPLCLRLIPAKIATENIIIEHIERPSAN